MKRVWPDDATRTVTVRATGLQLMAWTDAARLECKPHAGAWLAWAGDWAVRYSRELRRREWELDPIGARLAEKRVLGALLEAARAAVEHLPAPFHSAYSGARMDPRGDLRRAVDAVDAHLSEVQDEWAP